MNYESVKLADLFWADATFAVSSFVPTVGLQDSLQRQGILQPPWVWRKEDGQCVVVDGFKRLQWAQQAGLEAVECAVFPARADARELMLRRVEGKLFGAALNTAEKAQLVYKLSRYAPQRVMFDLYLPRLGIVARPAAAAKWLRLAVAADSLLTAAAEGRICERAALELADWEDQSLGRILPLLCELRCSASIQLEMIERVREIAIREDVDPCRILEDEEIGRILFGTEMNRRQKTEALRRFLYARRYPRINARVERFQRDLATLGLPANVAVIPPPGFEGKNWQVRLHFADPDELSETLVEMLATVSSDSFLKLL